MSLHFNANHQLDHQLTVMHIKYKYGKSSCKKINKTTTEETNTHIYTPSCFGHMNTRV